MMERNPGKVRRQWAPTFDPGKPCRNGHRAPRLISNKCCVECVREQDARRYALHPEKSRAVAKRWRDANPEQAFVLARAWAKANPELNRLRKKQYREANKEKTAEQNARWVKEHPVENRVIKNRRRARLLSAGGDHRPEQIHKMHENQKKKCISCKKSIRKMFHIDHIMPIAKGGTNDISNIQLLCPSCNMSKHAKDPIRWAQENGRLL